MNKYRLEQIIRQVIDDEAPVSRHEYIMAGVEAHRRFIQPEIDHMKLQISNYEWQINPDRMGGQ